MIFDDEYLEQLREMEETLNSPEVLTAQEILNSPQMRAARETLNSPQMRAAQEALNSPVVQAAQDVLNSPVIQAAQDALKYTSLQAAQEALIASGADFTKQLTQLQALNEEITVPYRTVHELIRHQSAVFEKLNEQIPAFDLVAFSHSQFAQTRMAWNVASAGLANRMSEIELLSQREMLSARLFEAPSAYTEFVRHTMEQLVADPPPDIAARLRGSLSLAEHQLLGIADTINDFIVVPDDETKPDKSRILNAPFRQQDELLSADEVEDETDFEAMTALAPAAQNVQRGRRVLELVTQCNEAGKTSTYSVEIFKPTTRLMAVFSDLPWLSPADRSSFGDLVDCLYFIFYEGAGKDNLRFLDKNGGPLDDTDCDLIWCIKHLRNKWLRHDADHGKEKAIEKSWTELAAKFRWLGLAEHPTDAHHFQQLHCQLLILAEDFLSRILNRLRLKQ